MTIAGAVLHQLALFHWHSLLLIMVLSWMTLRTTQLRACTCIHSLMMERKRCEDLDLIMRTCVLITYSSYSCINWSKVLWSPHLAHMSQTSLAYPSKLLNKWMLSLNNLPSNSRRKWHWNERWMDPQEANWVYLVKLTLGHEKLDDSAKGKEMLEWMKEIGRNLLRKNTTV